MKTSHIAQPLDFAGDDRWEVVVRILESPHFASSARLRDFLIHVTTCVLLDTPDEATEQQVGIRVFRRSPGFNTSEDSIVRSQARLLRMKLAAYFASEGASEEIVVEIPKGRYLPKFSPATESRDDHSVNGNGGHAIAAYSSPGWRASAGLSRYGLTDPKLPNLSYAAFSLKVHEFANGGKADRVSPVDILWGPIFAGPRAMAIYSNGPFLGSREEDPRPVPANAPEDATAVLDHYTGVGEVQSVFHITRLFERRGLDFVLKRSALVSWDDARHCNLIFIGSTTENPALRVLSPAQDFLLAPGSTAIVNCHPLPGEPETYERSNHPITRDYAVFSLRPGLMPHCKALVFSGLTTLGTQAAVEYACNAEAVADLLNQVVKDGEVRPFEAILEANITGGVPLLTRLAAIRVH